MLYQFKFNELTKEYFLRKDELNSIYFPNEVGYMNTINENINDDILLVKEDVYANNDFQMEAESGNNNNILIGIILEGGMCNKNNINITNKRNSKMFLRMDKGTHKKGIGILITKKFFENNLLYQLKDEKRMEIEKNYQNDISTIFKSSLVSSKTLALAQEIYNSPFCGILNNLYLQSRVYEIIHDEFLSIINEEDKRSMQNKIILNQDDIKALYKAKAFILKNKRHFSLAELSKKVALNQTKLKYGFKQFFNTTPGNIMFEARMYEAKRLLETSEYNATEIAQMTGYKYVQNFSNAFIKFFGKKPSDLMKSRKYYYWF